MGPYGSTGALTESTRNVKELNAFRGPYWIIWAFTGGITRTAKLTPASRGPGGEERCPPEGGSHGGGWGAEPFNDTTHGAERALKGSKGSSL